MDIPPLAGKTAALSLGALPVSYALNHLSALSQCVSFVRTTGLEGGRVGGGAQDGLSWAWGTPVQAEIPFLLL